jgi:hypothetical protein
MTVTFPTHAIWNEYKFEDRNIFKNLRSEIIQRSKSSRDITPKHTPEASEADEVEFEVPGYFLRLSRGDRVGLKTEDPIRSGLIAI